MRFDKCVVCGAPSAGRTGYVYMANGKSVVGAPFCQRHLNQVGIIIANPVFEDEEALSLFKQKHPAKYVKYVKNKQVIFVSEEAQRFFKQKAEGRFNPWKKEVIEWLKRHT